MLRKVMINHKEIPVPVPVKTLYDAYIWVEETLVRKHTIITKITLQGSEVLALTEKQMKNTPLAENAQLEFQIESPRDLAIQTLDAVRDLAYAMVKRFQPLAVKCWQLSPEVQLTELSEILDDMQLMLDLINHVNDMLDYTHADVAPVNGLARLVNRYFMDLQQARKSSDWKNCAHLLLNRLEGYLKELVMECENLQIRIFSTTMEEFEAQQLMSR